MYEEIRGRLQIGPIKRWPGELTQPGWRRPSPFSASFRQTLQLLDTELAAIGATAGLLGVAMDESDFRIDGMPRANARAQHPGVVLSFNPDGDARQRLEFATDRFYLWQDNLRAIALGMDALRKVDRYGITNGRQQYAGFRALPSGAADNSEGMHTVQDAERYLRALLADVETPLPSDFAREGKTGGDWLRTLVRIAARQTHPDTGGDPEAFRKVMRAKELIDA